MNNFQSWQEFFNSLGNVENHFFTKEQSEVVGSYLNARQNNIYLNFLDWFTTVPPCKLAQFMVIRKIGTTQLSHKQMNLNAINRSQEAYIEMINKHIDGLASLSASFSTAPTVDIKQAVIAVIIEAQIVTQITRLGGQTDILEQEIARNPFCIDCCEEVI